MLHWHGRVFVYFYRCVSFTSALCQKLSLEFGDAQDVALVVHHISGEKCYNFRVCECDAEYQS